MTSAIPVDVFNPGQALACMGIVEILSMLGHDAMSSFDVAGALFRVDVPDLADPVGMAVRAAMAATFPKDDTSDGAAKDGTASARPDDREEADGTEDAGQAKVVEAPATLLLAAGNRTAAITLDLWAPRDGRPATKFHAGQQTGRVILKDILASLDRIRHLPEPWVDPFEACAGIPKTASRYGLDTRTGRGAMANGWSPNATKAKPRTYPLVELLSLVGAQRVRLPETREGGARVVRHGLWTLPLPPTLARHALIGVFPTPGSTVVACRVESNGKASSLVRGGGGRTVRIDRRTNQG